MQANTSKPINLIALILSGAAWLALVSYEFIATTLIRASMPHVGYYVAALGVTIMLVFLMPRFGQAGLVVDLQEICLYDVFVQLFGLYLYLTGQKTTWYLILALAIFFLKNIRIIWGVATFGAGVASRWPTFGLIGLLRRPTPAAPVANVSRLWLVCGPVLAIAIGYFSGHHFQAHLEYFVAASFSIPCIFAFAFTKSGIRHLRATEAERLAAIEAKINSEQHAARLEREKNAIISQQNATLKTAYADLETEKTQVDALLRQRDQIIAELAAKNTELEAMHQQEAKIAHELAERNESLRDASHDLTQPLNTLRFYADRARMLATTDEQAAQLDAIKSGLNAVASMMHSIIEQAKASTQLTVPTLSAIPVAQLASDMRDAFFEAARARCIYLEIKNKRDGVVLSNPILLKRIISNLMTNAIQHSPPETGVQLQFYRSKHTCDIWVWNQSSVIPNANGPDRVANFTAFIEQCKTDMANEEPHTIPTNHGLGLISVQRLCAELSLAMQLKSREGLGTIFFFRVPLAE